MKNRPREIGWLAGVRYLAQPLSLSSFPTLRHSDAPRGEMGINPNAGQQLLRTGAQLLWIFLTLKIKQLFYQQNGFIQE